MSYWDSKKGEIIRYPPTVCEWRSHWFRLDCGCCGGLEWGGESPVECRRCKGGGELYLHLPSGVLAQYPGGPFCGVATAEELDAAKSLDTNTEERPGT